MKVFFPQPLFSLSLILLPVFGLQAQESIIPEETSYEVLSYLEPYRSIEMFPVETGNISEIKVQRGQEVTAGQELLRLDTELIDARLAVARSQADNIGRVQAARAEHNLALDQLEKIEGLERRGSANEAEVARNRAAVEGAEGNLIAAQEDKKVNELQVKQIEAELERRIIRSPIDGFVVDITRDLGETVTLSQAREDAYLIRLVQLHLLRCEGHIPEEAAAGLALGDELAVRLEDGQTTVGKIDFVSPITDPSTSTVTVRLVIENESNQYRSGSRAVILVPRSLSPQD